MKEVIWQGLDLISLQMYFWGFWLLLNLVLLNLVTTAGIYIYKEKNTPDIFSLLSGEQTGEEGQKGRKSLYGDYCNNFGLDQGSSKCDEKWLRFYIYFKGGVNIISYRSWI